MFALQSGLSEISALQSLSRLRHLTLSVLGQDQYGRGVLQACFPELQTLGLILFAYIVPLCPVLCRLGLSVGLTSTDGSRVLNLTYLTGLRARQLAFEVGSDHILYAMSNFADWKPESASIIVKDRAGSMVPCRGCCVGREPSSENKPVLELPKHMVQEDTIL